MKTPRHPTNLSQSTYRAGILQSQAYRALTVFMNTHLKPYDMSLAEWSLVGLVYEAQQPIRPSQAADILSIKQPVVTNLVNKLVEKGILTRRHDPTDSRAAIIALTDSGNDLAAIIEDKLREQMREFLHDIDRVELAIYLAVMEKIAAKL